MAAPETQRPSVDAGNPLPTHETKSGSDNELAAIGRFNIPLLLGAVVGLLVLLIGYWTEHLYLALAGVFGVLVMTALWVLHAWLILIRSFSHWFSSRRGSRGHRRG